MFNAEWFQSLKEVDTFEYRGRVSRVTGMMVEAVLPNASIGETCVLAPPNQPPIMAEIVGLREGKCLMMPLGSSKGLSVGTPVRRTSGDGGIKVGPGCLGRVLDGLGRPIDGLGELEDVVSINNSPRPINPLHRKGIQRPLDLGVRAINGLLTIGEGQRIAIVAGAGVGKSTLLGMMARNTDAEVVVIGLIGERGREVQEFVENDLRVDGALARHVCVVAATGDEPPSMRLRAANTATTIAEYFRGQGLRVLLLMDSLTRVVMAQREIGLSVGEPPATRGYPPSAFALIPGLLERTGMGEKGSITAIYTTLVEGDDPDDPVGDAVRGTTDGHIVLSRSIAEQGQYPAIDVVKSVSRVMRQVTDEVHQAAAQTFRQFMVDLNNANELVSLGAYRKGTNPTYDTALLMAPKLKEFLVQNPDDAVGLDASIRALEEAVVVPQAETANPFRREASRSYVPLKS
ncbi:FliI/YscN family ATPase [Microvenator marinus]|jgi:flagellum-specific ATP synthase|uniref:FliI/YscN family ATPase n=1 Tax=Microvenator marinus TaxID=2600177 RepID=A0A5B8XYX5_9DELT|nr:FliI/YscN family ATPase [Microvenator marinus]QED28649.1 FliI/YscN family ATPase [Microvenator marinus]